MLIVKYSKTRPAKYASHVDTLRAMGRILARADVSPLPREKNGMSSGVSTPPPRAVSPR